MAESFSKRLKNAWNIFMNRDPPNRDPYSYDPYYYDLETRNINLGLGSGYRPDRSRLTRGNERTIITSLYDRIAMDCSTITINHARLDENGRFKEIIDSGLNYCLNVEANKDQTGRSFIQDYVLSLCDNGCVAIVPIDTDKNPLLTDSYDIHSFRIGRITQWFPDYVQVNLYNDRTGLKEDVILPKRIVGIVENPLYSIMNEPNSVLQRLIKKLNLLDVVDEQSSAGKLDLIVQLPYVVKTDTKKKIAEERKKDIEAQLSNSKYGIAYIDATEKITQLNRPIDNHLMEQIGYLTDMVYSQMGMTKSILEGTANDQEMLNYNNRIIEPIMSALVDELKRKFLTKTARSQGQSIIIFRDPFKLVPINQIADIADKLTRNEILTSNEVRQMIGMKPVDNPRADELINKNINTPEGMYPEMGDPYSMDQNQNGYQEEPVQENTEEEIENPYIRKAVDSVNKVLSKKEKIGEYVK